MTRVCIFDIDNTLTHGNKVSNCCDDNTNHCIDDSVSPNWPTSGSGTTQYVKDAINACRDNGYELAVASAESGSEAVNDKQQKFIDSLFPKKIYGSALYQNACTAQGVDPTKLCKGKKSDPPCCTNEFENKTAMYINIANKLGIHPSDYGDSIVFDDDQSNLTTANDLGFLTCQASPGCGGKYCESGCGLPSSCLRLIKAKKEKYEGGLSSSQTGKKLSAGAIAGIVIGSFFGLLILIMAIRAIYFYVVGKHIIKYMKR